jgi:drug/metabolite transporter (DMT)-like permease
MEPEERDEQNDPFKSVMVQFFVKIMRTMFLGFFWMIVNVFLGLFLGMGVPDESTPGRMIFFYSWLVLTLVAYLYAVWRWWRRKLPPP